MPNLELTLTERVALRELELSVVPPQALWSVLGPVKFYEDGTHDLKSNIEFARETFYINLKPTQLGQLRAYVRANAKGNARLLALYAKLEGTYQQAEPLYNQSKARYH